MTSEAPGEAAPTEPGRSKMLVLWERVRHDRILLGLAAAVVVLLVAVIGFMVLSVTNYNASVSWKAAADARDDQLEQMSRANDDLRLDVDRYRPAYMRESELEREEIRLTALETETAEREAAVTTAEAEITSRETAVKAREDAATANATAGDWWVPQIRECLARPGGYRMASATEGSLGRDVSCMSG